MASNRIGRINEEIQRELAELIRTLKDPRVQGLISVTGVETLHAVGGRAFALCKELAEIEKSLENQQQARRAMQ